MYNFFRKIQIRSFSTNMKKSSNFIFIPNMKGMPVYTADFTECHVRLGDSVVAGQVLCQIETYKAVIDISADVDGVVSWIGHPVGTIDLSVGTHIMSIEPNT